MYVPAHFQVDEIDDILAHQVAQRLGIPPIPPQKRLLGKRPVIPALL